MTLPQEITDRIENSQRERQQAPTEPMLPALPALPEVAKRPHPFAHQPPFAILGALAMAGAEIPKVPEGYVRIIVKNRHAMYVDVPPRIAAMAKQCYVFQHKNGRIYLRNVRHSDKPLEVYCGKDGFILVDMTEQLNQSPTHKPAHR